MLTLGEKIRLARQKRGLTQSALAKKAGVCRETISNIECGKNSNPEWITLDSLLRSLDLQVESFGEIDSF